MNSEPDESPWWRIAVLACVMLGLPMLLVWEHPQQALYAWLLAVAVYLGLLLLFGTRFVIEGALFGFIFACLLAALLHAVHAR